MMTYQLPKADKNAERVRTYAARFAIAAGLALMLTGLSFAGQAGIGLASRLADHQHTGAGDGAQLMGLNPIGNFYINTNSEGNIVIASQPSGGIFYWRPKRQAFRAGFSSGSDFYDLNVGSYSWAGGYNSSAGNFGLGFGTDAHADGAASVALGYYVKATAYNSMIFGSGPGFGSPAYAVNNATGSIQFFPFTITASTEAMLALYRDGTARATGAWNFTSTPTINGMAISTYAAVDTSKVAKTGDTMTGTLVTPNVTASSVNVVGTTVKLFTVNKTDGGNSAQIGGNVGSLLFQDGANTMSLIAQNGAGTGTVNRMVINPYSISRGITMNANGDINVGPLTTLNNKDFSVAVDTFTVHNGAVTIGSLFYANPAAVPDRIGINTGSPQGELDIKSNQPAGGKVLYVSSQNATQMFTVRGDGKVAIGNITPTYTLDVSGNIRSSSGFLGAGGYDTDATDSRFFLQTRDADNASAAAFELRNDPALTTAGGKLFLVKNSNTELFTIAYNGNVGLSTAAPSSQLTIGAGGQSWVDGYASGVYAVSEHASALSSGTVVTYSDFGTSLAITTAAANSDVPVGTIYDQSCAAGARCRVCLTGICPARIITTGACARAADQYVVAGSETGRAECVTSPAAAIHNREIGQPASWSAVNGDVISIWAHRN